VGKVIPGVEVKFVDGEIVVKSNDMIQGYADDPVLSAQRFKDGWYYTGDLGHMQDDLLIYDRRKA
jgi:long-chain acyl-CoA synthetase